LIDSYAWAGGREAMLRFGPANGPVVIAALPLFEEANRTRAFVVTILRQLALRGFAGAMPDLPGTGESIVETEQTSLSDWIDAFKEATEALRPTYETVHVIAFRGGALVDRDAMVDTCWHFSPLPGAIVTRDLGRVALAAAKEAGTHFDPATLTAPGSTIEIAGNRLTRKLLAEIERAEPASVGPVRTVRLKTDPLTADRHIDGAPLWRRSDPDNDSALAALLADDIAGWIASCGG
jgi:alpha-beta hydrolase superfamily lysophospholipase